MRIKRNDEPICAYRNEKMNQINALIIMRRNTTAATTQIIINVIFERRNELALGNISKIVFLKKKRKSMLIKEQLSIILFTSCIHRLI